MLDTNVGEMPFEIFGDYVADCLGIEYDWLYAVCILNGNHPYDEMGHGRGYGYGNEVSWGNGLYFTYAASYTSSCAIGFSADCQAVSMNAIRNLIEQGSRGDSNGFGDNGRCRY